MSTAPQFVFFIIGKDDRPIYHADLASKSKHDDSAHLNEFIVHAALDLVDASIWQTRDMNLKIVDRFNDSHVSSFVTASHIRFMMLHKTKIEEHIKNFFMDTYELFMKIVLNPFYDMSTPITSQAFDARVRGLAKRHLNV